MKEKGGRGRERKEGRKEELNHSKNEKTKKGSIVTVHSVVM